MSTHYLTATDDIEKLRANLAGLSGRPARVVSTLSHNGSDARYREPEAERYRVAGVLELFLSQWDDRGCVGFDEGPPRLRKFDLHPARWVRLVYPLLPEERIERWDNPHFKAIGVQPALNGDPRTLFLSREDHPPADLAPYVHEYRHRPGQPLAMVIRFAVSTGIEAPYERRPAWHLAVPFGNKYHTAQSVQAPGWYSGREIGTAEPINRICFVEESPERCVVCRGKSGERIHLAIVASGQSAYPDGLICRVCAPGAVAEWLSLLATWTPPENPARGTP